MSLLKELLLISENYSDSFKKRNKMTPDIELALRLIIDYTENGEEVFHNGMEKPIKIDVKKLDAAIETVIKFGKVNYTGKMFRSIGFDKKEISNLSSLKSKIQSYARKEYQPFSKKISGMKLAVEGLISTEHILSQGIVIAQTGTGVDINKLKKFVDKMDGTYDYDMMNSDFEDEHEVLSKIENFEIYGTYEYDDEEQELKIKKVKNPI